MKLIRPAIAVATAAILFLPLTACRPDPEAAPVPAATATATAPADLTEQEKIVDKMIAAHGGMEVWAAAPAISFEDEFKQGEADSGLVSRVVVEQGPRRAFIEYPTMDMRLGWDGRSVWSENWQLPYPPRFLALLNYYFANLPWLARDPGVVLGEPGSATLWDEPVEYTTIRMTFEPGVGDTPDDYYLLYIDPESHRLVATEYIVTYRPLLPDGAEATDPHILVYDEWTAVDGLQLPAHYTIYENDRSVYGSCDFRHWSLAEPFDESLLEMPAGAEVDESLG